MGEQKGKKEFMVWHVTFKRLVTQDEKSKPTKQKLFITTSICKTSIWRQQKFVAKLDYGYFESFSQTFQLR
jgi:hypothetical protein